MKLVAVLVAFFITSVVPCSVNAQPVAGIIEQQITNNLITNPTFNGTTGWTTTGGVGGNGPTHPATPANGNGYTFTFSQGTIAQTYAINQALAHVGAGVQIAGFDYGFKYRFGCANKIGGYCEDLAGLQDTLNATSTITSSTGSTLYTRYYALGMNAPAPYSATFSSVDTQQRFSAALPVENLGDFRISFTGMDAGYWGGNYGPTIKDIYSKAVYTVDPCAGNPAYSPSCPGYNTVVTSPNLLTGMTGTQAYAINQALANVGAGAMIHGFNYGYDYSVAGRQCAIWDLFGFCLSGWNYSDAGVATVITDSNSATIYSSSNTHNGGDNGTSGTYSKQFRFGTSRQITTLGGFAMSPWTSGNASITNMYSNAVYTVDPCLDPLSSPSCPGYQQAYQNQQCAINPLFNSACPGYAQAVFTQQCSANPLSDAACPGYASAYLTYQCSINPLYSTTCSGYEAAYLDQQCSINPLYSSRCSGYATAYKNQQCTADPLYATDCPGYEQAYLNSQCIRDSLYSRLCEGYSTAYAIKYLTPISSDSTVASAVNGSLSDTAAVKANDPATTKVAVNTVTTSINTDGSVSTGVSTTGDTNVDKAITAKASTTNTAPAAVQLAPPPPPPQQQMAQNEPRGGGDRKSEGGDRKSEGGDRKSESGEKKEASERKLDGGDKPAGGSQQAQGGNSSSDKPAAPTVRQELQARREAAAKAEAIEKGKNLANEMGKAADMEAQKAVQSVVIQAMGFNPGFDTYNKTMIPDVPGYKPYDVYKGQRNIDNPSGRRFMTGSDKLHMEMIESQYNFGRN